MSVIASLSSLDRSARVGATDAARLLHPVSRPRPLRRTELAQVLESLANPYRDQACIDELVRRSAVGAARLRTREGDRPASERHFECILRTETVEAWLIAWSRSAFLELHDHGGSAGAVRVLSGELEETFTVAHSGAELATRRFAAGASFSFGADHVHELGNSSETPAVSLHVYSPRLTVMNFYRRRGPNVLEPVRTERYRYT